MTIDIEKLRRDLLDACYAGYFAGGIGGLLVESIKVENASPEELVEMAKEQGIDLRKYEV